MPIAVLGDDYLDQQCALCEDVHRVAYSQLEAGGASAPSADDPNVLALPPCPVCHAREFLIRSSSDVDEPGADAPADPGESHRHQSLVNQLCQRIAAVVDRNGPHPET
jgi:hypothetical protein